MMIQAKPIAFRNALYLSDVSSREWFTATCFVWITHVPFPTSLAAAMFITRTVHYTTASVIGHPFSPGNPSKHAVPNTAPTIGRIHITRAVSGSPRSTRNRIRPHHLTAQSRAARFRPSGSSDTHHPNPHPHTVLLSTCTIYSVSLVFPGVHTRRKTNESNYS